MDWKLVAAVTVLGFGSSMVNGLLGAGGAIVLIPLFVYGLPALSGRHLETHMVTGLTLVAGVASSLGGSIGHHRSGNLELGPMWRHGPVLAVGALAGSVGSVWVSGRFLLILFGCMTVAAAVFLIYQPAGKPGQRPRPLLADLLFLGVGVLGGALGVGAGFLIIPVLMHILRVPSRSAQATGLAVVGLAVLPALLGKAVTGQVPWLLAPFVFVAAVAGSLAGATASSRLPARGLRLGLVGVVSLMGIRVWVDLLGL